MTLYRITAPNGVTYQTEGPPNATPEQIKAVILKAHPEAAKPAPAGQPAPTAQPTATQPTPVKDGSQDEGGFFSELGKGLRTGFNQLTNVPSAFGLQMSGAGASEWNETLSLFDQVDAGKYKAKEFISPAAAAAMGAGSSDSE